MRNTHKRCSKRLWRLEIEGHPDKRTTDTLQHEAGGTTTGGPDVTQTTIPSCVLLPLDPTAVTPDPSAHTFDTTSTSRLEPARY